MAALLVGSYTDPGSGAGVSLFPMDDGGLPDPVATRTSAGVRNPSFLADAGDVLYAVEEVSDGQLVALDPTTLAILWRVPTGGADPCHVVAEHDRVFVANYSSGTAVILSPDGADPVLLANPGSGPVPGRQDDSHAHQATVTPWGTLLVSDLGADRVDEYAIDTARLLDSARLPPGTGPRHVALQGDFLLVAGELDSNLHVLRRETGPAGEGTWHWLHRVPLASAGSLPSHVELSGSRLYASVRGADTIVTLDVSGLAAGEPPRRLGSVPCGGAWPRHFAVAQGRILVANERSHTVSILALDADGVPGPEPVHRLSVGSPTCVVLRPEPPLP